MCAIKFSIALLFALLIGDAAAAGSKGPRNSCPMPDRPLVTQNTELSVSVNTYQKGSALCIVNFIPENCPLCKPGWRHRCSERNDGQWLPFEQCSSKEKEQALAQSRSSAGDRDASTTTPKSDAVKGNYLICAAWLDTGGKYISGVIRSSDSALCNSFQPYILKSLGNPKAGLTHTWIIFDTAEHAQAKVAGFVGVHTGWTGP